MQCLLCVCVKSEYQVTAGTPSGNRKRIRDQIQHDEQKRIDLETQGIRRKKKKKTTKKKTTKKKSKKKKDTQIKKMKNTPKKDTKLKKTQKTPPKKKKKETRRKEPKSQCPRCRSVLRAIGSLHENSREVAFYCPRCGAKLQYDQDDPPTSSPFFMLCLDSSSEDEDEYNVVQPHEHDDVYAKTYKKLDAVKVSFVLTACRYFSCVCRYFVH